MKKYLIPVLCLYALLSLYAVVSIFTGVGYNPLLTPVSSLTAFIFALFHARQYLGWKYTLLLLGLTFCISLTFESVGVATGWVYGKYHYTSKLGIKFLDLVPLIIPVAWFMMSYPSFIIARRILPRLNNPRLPRQRSLWLWRIALAATGSVVMTAWDLAMDPMMVAGGHWVWDQPGAYFDIPIQNYWGWWLTIFVAFLLFLVLGRITPDSFQEQDRSFERMGILSYLITSLSTIVVDFRGGLAGAGLVGLFAMSPWLIFGWLGNEEKPS